MIVVRIRVCVKMVIWIYRECAQFVIVLVRLVKLVQVIVLLVTGILHSLGIRIGSWIAVLVYVRQIIMR
jgi:hypothetical protein